MMLRRVKRDVEKSLLPKLQAIIYPFVLSPSIHPLKHLLTRPLIPTHTRPHTSKQQCILYVHLTPLQVNWYKSVISKAGAPLALLSFNQLTATFSQLNRVANHPKQILLKRIADRKIEQNRVNNLASAGSEIIRMREELREPEPSSVAGIAEAELRALTGQG